MNMKSGTYKSVNISNMPEFLEDEFATELMNNIYWYYDEFLFNRDGVHVDNDTSCNIYADFDIIDGEVNYIRARAEFEFVDEMNDVVLQTMYIDFANGDICIKDDDLGVIYNGNDSAFSFG